MDTTLEPMPEGWQRLLAIVAHPDDLEYGAASAVARWTQAGQALGVKHAVALGRVQLAGV